jgi:hypothetical protein
LWLILIFAHGGLLAGPYSTALNAPANLFDAPVPGFVGPDGEGNARIDDGSGGFINEHNFVNPLFLGWATDVASYAPALGVAPSWSDADLALGSVTGDNFDIVSLGDLNASQINAGNSPGSITLHFANPIRNFSGADFVIFENAFISDYNTGGTGIGGIFGDLAYVEASSDGVNFIRFPSASLTPAAVGAFGSIDSTNVFNLAGKHVNAGGSSWGTPFDLGAVGLSSVSYIRLVDIPGNGAFRDSANRPIYDAWVTAGSGGIDVEAIGAISRAVTFDEWQDLRGLAGAQRGAWWTWKRMGFRTVLEYAFARLPKRADAEPAVCCGSGGWPFVFTFTRDERAVDLTYDVQAASNLAAADWTTIARSAAGQPTIGVNGFAPVITETSGSGIASVGVVRKVRVVDVETIAANVRRFLRLKVTITPP